MASSPSRSEVKYSVLPSGVSQGSRSSPAVLRSSSGCVTANVLVHRAPPSREQVPFPFRTTVAAPVGCGRGRRRRREQERQSVVAQEPVHRAPVVVIELRDRRRRTERRTAAAPGGRSTFDRSRAPLPWRRAASPSRALPAAEECRRLGVFRPTTLTGVDQPTLRFGRVDTQMSVPPAPPERSDPNQSVSPSAAMAALVSNEGVLSSLTAVGGSKGRSAAGRRAVQMSPLPESRVEVKKISSRSLVKVGLSARTEVPSSTTGRAGPK